MKTEKVTIRPSIPARTQTPEQVIGEDELDETVSSQRHVLDTVKKPCQLLCHLMRTPESSGCDTIVAASLVRTKC